MSIVAIALNLLLAGLLAVALVMGWRLNRRLAVLRESHEGFTKAVAELDVAAQRAEQGLADLRAATDEAVDLLADRIEKARALSQKLDRQLSQAPMSQAPMSQAQMSQAQMSQAPAAQPAAARRGAPAADHEAELELRQPLDMSRLGALLGGVQAVRARPAPAAPAPRREAAPPPSRMRGPDDDLFEDAPPQRRTISSMVGGFR
jgi:hypothetical protein